MTTTYSKNQTLSPNIRNQAPGNHHYHENIQHRRQDTQYRGSNRNVSGDINRAHREKNR